MILSDRAMLFEKRTGLRLNKANFKGKDEYWVMSPTGMRMFRVGFDTERAISMGMLEMNDAFQSRLIFKFSPRNLEMVLKGKKTQTRRFAAHGSWEYGAIIGAESFKVFGRNCDLWVAPKANLGEFISVCDENGEPTGKRAKVIGVGIEKLHEIDDEDIRSEGFESRQEFEAEWRRIYPEGNKSWDENPVVFVYEWEPSSPVTFEMLDVGDLFNLKIDRCVKTDGDWAMIVAGGASKAGSLIGLHGETEVIPLWTQRGSVCCGAM